MSIVGRVSYDELDIEIVNAIKSASGSKELNNDFKIKDSNNQFASLGLGSEFGFNDFLKAMGELVKSYGQMTQFIKSQSEENFAQRIATLESQKAADAHTIESLKNTVESLNKTIAELKKHGVSPSPGGEPERPEVHDTDTFVTNSGDLEVDNSSTGSLSLGVRGGEKLNIPSTPFVTRAYAAANHLLDDDLRSNIEKSVAANAALIKDMNNLKKFDDE